ncbi:dTDP-glucose 4,6-dehydratase [Leptospira fletcheri]|uniref:dTDP-glucose 4,6-dehydratase n=1 Tax=Leptospira fletcheri TaxID=2484981 RepID=A0A4R9GDX2_9LEPT|nr:dTDP-glucose 4,6-dehydratase [Leptospira fletcheri]TGK09941.1 dTDP-glucose 4,6-dehydratase [Leptospira fletcheri]
MQKILITGGAGFIGSNLVHSILRDSINTKVVVLDKLTYSGNLNNLSEWFSVENFEFEQLDITNPTATDSVFEKHSDFKAVIHLAAESHVDRSIVHPGDFINTNVVGTFNLLESFKKRAGNKRGPRFLHVSTDEVFGSLSLSEPSFTEHSNYKPNSPYSASKAASDHLVRSYFHTYHLDVLTTNCSNNFGPFQFPEKLIPVTIISCLEWKKIPIYGNGENIRDWLYVEDHCDALRLVLADGIAGETYNIGGRNEYKNIEIVSFICEIMDRLIPKSESYKSLVYFVGDRPGHDFRYSIDPAKMESVLGWTPRSIFKDALEVTVQWYIENEEWWRDIRSGKKRRNFESKF